MISKYLPSSIFISYVSFYAESIILDTLFLKRRYSSIFPLTLHLLRSFIQSKICWVSQAGWYEPRHDKTNKMTVRPEKNQISLGIRPVWSESSLCAKWVAKDPSFLHADSEDSDQTGRMPRLIWVFAGLTVTLLVLSCRGSYFLFILCDMSGGCLFTISKNKLFQISAISFMSSKA